MRTKKYTGTEERSVLTALIVHDQVLAKVRSALRGETEPFKNRWSNLIAGWCFSYFDKYHAAPRRAITERFAQYAETAKDENVVELIDSFLTSLSSSHDKIEQLAQEMNEQYLVDTASAFFHKIRLERLSEDIADAVSAGDLERAKKAQVEFQPPAFASSDWSDPFQIAEMKETFRRHEDERSILIPLKGDMGRFLSPYFKEGGFISFAGPEKRGKSYWLMEMVWQAIRARRRVLYYAFGDMSKDEIKMRLYSRIAHLPIVLTEEEKDGLSIPERFSPPKKKGDPYSIDWKPKKTYPILTGRDAWEASKPFRIEAADGTSRLKLMCRGADEVSASMIEADVLDYRRKGWVPDVVVVDYADLLAPEPGTQRLEIRHRIDASWKILRRIALNNHNLMLTATQTGADSYKATFIGPEHFSEDKRKNAHVTGMLGINQTEEEKELGVYRLNWILIRGGKWSRFRSLYTIGNLAISNPCILNTL